MKLRIAKIQPSRLMAAGFLVQMKGLFLWHDMYYDPKDDKLLAETMVILGRITKRAVFDDFHEAHRLAQIFKSENAVRERILETWEV